jgi:phosphoribosylaminoimidazole-succinocarboxamide synthase
MSSPALAKRLGIEEGTQLPRTIVEYYYKDDALGDPMVTDEHILAFGWAAQEEMHDIADMAIRVNDFLSACSPGSASAWSTSSSNSAASGTMNTPVILADEISPDGCRLWDMATNEKLDKDRFRRDLGGEVEAYQEVARRLGLLPEGADSAVLDLESHRKRRGK